MWTIRVLVIFCFRGDPADPHSTLVVSRWTASGVHDHQWLAGAEDGSPLFHRSTVPHQPGISLPKGKSSTAADFLMLSCKDSGGNPHNNTYCFKNDKTNRRLWYSLFNSEDNRNTIPPCIKLKSNPTYLISSWSLQAGEENPVVHLSVVSLNGPLHTVLMKKPDDPRIGWVTAWVFLIVCESLKIALPHCLKMSWRLCWCIANVCFC